MSDLFKNKRGQIMDEAPFLVISVIIMIGVYGFVGIELLAESTILDEYSAAITIVAVLIALIFIPLVFGLPVYGHNVGVENNE